MPETSLPGSSMSTSHQGLVQQLSSISGNMAVWMKLLGIVYIVQAAITTLFTFFVGIIVAWLPLWLGILLFQAGNRASMVAVAKKPEELVSMLDKLRLFFIINGVVLIVFLAIGIMALILVGGNVFSVMHHFQEMNF